jgi:hypothetical protein
MILLCYKSKKHFLGHNLTLRPHEWIRKLLPIKIFIRFTWKVRTPPDWFK